MSCGCNSTTTTTTTTSQCPEPACNCPPSPTPPYARAVQSPQVQTLTGNGAITLAQDTTYLVQVAVNPDDQSPQGPFAIVLPDGIYKRQYKRIFIPKERALDTAVFNVAGTFVGFTSLTLNNLAYSALLEWDGSGWHLLGGNAVPNP